MLRPRGKRIQMNALTRSVIANLLMAAPVAAQTYEAGIIPPQLIGSPATTTPLALGDDSTTRIDLGFEFTYWGQVFSSAWVSSNGFVSFQSPAHLCCNGAPIEQAQRNTIYGFWTDLISPTSPYYRRDTGSILFGWYNTSEYGTQNKYTFELGLFDDGKIQFNYGNMPSLTYHYATAGITGPAWTDNIQLFYGRDPYAMKAQSGILRWTTPPPPVDCNVTPMDPSCPPEVISPAPSAPNPVGTATAVADASSTTQDDPATETQIAQNDETAIALTEPEQDAQAEIVVSTETQTEATSITVQVADAIAAERLTPDQVAALAAGAPSVDLTLPTTGFTIQIGATQSSGGSSYAPSAAVEASTATNSPSSVANTLEALNMTSAPLPMATAQSEQTANSLGAGQAETIEAIASVPGFSAYTQVSLQDRPDFYAIRDIYRNRRLRDANWEMYRMMQTNDAKWQEIVNGQYR
jgi:hypothetical protein